jgi:hypothetical protein
MKGAYKNDIKQLTSLSTFSFTFTIGFGLGILHFDLTFNKCKSCPPTSWFSKIFFLLFPKGFSQSIFFFPKNAHQQVGFQALHNPMAPTTGFHHQILFEERYMIVR